MFGMIDIFSVHTFKLFLAKGVWASKFNRINLLVITKRRLLQHAQGKEGYGSKYHHGSKVIYGNFIP
jgi:hypothetical protein